MSFNDFVPLVQSLRSVIADAPSAAQAWQEIRERERAIGCAVTDVPDGDIEAEIDLIAAQLRQIFDESPPPHALQLIWFGLFAALNTTTWGEEAGYYFGGSTNVIPFVIDSSSELAGDVLDYRPAHRYLESPLLQRIKVAAMGNKADYDRYDYAVMLGAAAVLSLHAVRRLGMSTRVVVGFDSGDSVDLQA